MTATFHIMPFDGEPVFATPATMVPGAPGYWDWVHGICPRCRTSLAGWISQSDWNGPNLRHQLTFPLTLCWLCRVQTGGWASAVFEA